MFRSDSTKVAKLSSDKNSAPKPTDFTRIFESDADSVAWVCDIQAYESPTVAIVFSVQKIAPYTRPFRPEMRYFYTRWDGKKWFCAQMAQYAGNTLHEAECDYTGLRCIIPADAERCAYPQIPTPQPTGPF